RHQPPHPRVPAGQRLECAVATVDPPAQQADAPHQRAHPSWRHSARVTLIIRVRERTNASRTLSCLRTDRHGSAVRWAARYRPARQASHSARPSRRSVLIRRFRVAYIAAYEGAPTTTSWPSDSSRRATHSLSDDHPRRTRRGGRPAKNAVSAARLVPTVCSSSYDPSAAPARQITLDLRCRSIAPYCMAGLLASKPSRHVRVPHVFCGALSPPRAGGQPFHPILSLPSSPWIGLWHLAKHGRGRPPKPASARVRRVLI